MSDLANFLVVLAWLEYWPALALLAGLALIVWRVSRK